MSTKENNKLISEFMGYENVGTLNNPMYDYYDNDFQDGIYKVEDLQYHKSWDWLMPVVSKCFKTGDDTHEWDNIMDTLFTCDRDIVYAEIVEFINQYNKNK